MNWGGGYITDVAYMPGYYVQQAPDRMVLAAQVAGYETPYTLGSAERESLSYLELGCGEGAGAIILAASNPGWRVTAVDFNPAHIAGARRLAADAGIDNITFLEADLATLAESAQATMVPEADVVSLHGVWSWVPQPVQAGIVRLLRDRVRPGGLVHVSYNSLPGWQGATALQRVVREAGLRLAGRSDQQAMKGLQVVRDLLAAGAAQIEHSPLATSLLAKLDDMPAEYIAHEYMNKSWTPCFHADVVEALGAAKLDWIGTSQPLECFLDLMLTPAQREIHDRFEDPLLRELVKDTCAERLLRHDLFIRGARRCSEGERDAALAQTTLMLIVAPDNFEFEVQVPAGKATMTRDVYGPIVAALAEGPRTLSELLALPALAGRQHNLPEIASMLVGSGQAVPLARPDAAQGAPARRFNDAAARRLVRLDRLARGVGAASTRLGGGFVVPIVELFLIERTNAAGGVIDGRVLAAELAPGLDAEAMQRLVDRIQQSFDKQGACWRHAGLV